MKCKSNKEINLIRIGCGFRFVNASDGKPYNLRRKMIL